jgi:hypothetical protein
VRPAETPRGWVLRALQSCSPHLRSPPASFHLHSPWQRAGVLLVVYSTAQRCSALPRNSSSEQDWEIGSSYLEFERRAYSPTTVAPSPNAYGLERSSAHTVFAISWLTPSDSRIPPANASRWPARSNSERAPPSGTFRAPSDRSLPEPPGKTLGFSSTRKGIDTSPGPAMWLRS